MWSANARKAAAIARKNIRRQTQLASVPGATFRAAKAKLRKLHFRASVMEARAGFGMFKTHKGSFSEIKNYARNSWNVDRKQGRVRAFIKYRLGV